jgi:hypothetical protein
VGRVRFGAGLGEGGGGEGVKRGEVGRGVGCGAWGGWSGVGRGCVPFAARTIAKSGVGA